MRLRPQPNERIGPRRRTPKLSPRALGAVLLLLAIGGLLVGLELAVGPQGADQVRLELAAVGYTDIRVRRGWFVWCSYEGDLGYRWSAAEAVGRACVGVGGFPSIMVERGWAPAVN